MAGDVAKVISHDLNEQKCPLTCLLGLKLGQLRVELEDIILQALQSVLQLTDVLQLAYA